MPTGSRRHTPDPKHNTSCGCTALWSIKAAADGEIGNADADGFVHLWCSLIPSDWYKRRDIPCWHLRFINNVFFMDVRNNSSVAVTHVRMRCRSRSRSRADTRGDTPCRSCSRRPPAALCGTNNNKSYKTLAAGPPRCQRLHVKWNPRSLFFRGHKLNCKHVEIQCLTEICKDKQMSVNVPFQLQCLSYVYWRFNFKIPWIAFGLRIASKTNPRIHLMS